MSNQHISAVTEALIDELKLTLEADLDAIAGEWDGDDPGELEDRAVASQEAFDLWHELLDIVDELA